MNFETMKLEEIKRKRNFLYENTANLMIDWEVNSFFEYVKIQVSKDIEEDDFNATITTLLNKYVEEIQPTVIKIIVDTYGIFEAIQIYEYRYGDFKYNALRYKNYNSLIYALIENGFQENYSYEIFTEEAKTIDLLGEIKIDGLSESIRFEEKSEISYEELISSQEQISSQEPISSQEV